ncbi:Sideroflexin-1 [Acipenser ruthenus]|uniref:Sideroflexin-3 n=1 Tax=Acipenser ruthenus TaxID=7906 RepID=A0A444U9E3_ACIRT|nr:Sideroflexin-1 [Acipenser ruthenus]
MSSDLSLNIDIKEPRWDQGTFMGRAKHFFTVTDPRNVFLSSEVLEDSRRIVENYRVGIVSPGLTEDELWRAKYVYDSAFHPDTGEKMILVGRMSAQVPMNMTITGCMLTFYRSTPAVVFWQWVNQSFNAVVNYTNRSGDAPMTVKELKYGIPVTDEDGKRLGESTSAAQQAIVQVIVSRIGMAVPAMAIPPVIMNALEKRAFLKRYPVFNAPIQVGLVGFCSMKVSSLEAELQAQIQERSPHTAVVYFNKGL